MELRKDPITRSWVITGDDVIEPTPRSASLPVLRSFRRTCASHCQPARRGWRRLVGALRGASPCALPHRRRAGAAAAMASMTAWDRSARTKFCWKIRATTAISGMPATPKSNSFCGLAALRIQDLKRDSRFKYISIFKNHGEGAGQEFEHPTSQLTATTFVPRRVLYELRAGRDYFETKERCVFCDILAQEERQGLRIVEIRGDYVAFCPYAPRVPYETWIMPRSHEASFERTGSSRVGSVTDLAALLRRTLQRIRTVTEAFHLVLHTSPNSQHPSATLGYWKTLDDDYHWHIEILPIVEAKARSYTFKEDLLFSGHFGDCSQTPAQGEDLVMPRDSSRRREMPNEIAAVSAF